MAPEQSTSKYNHLVDFWSFGICILELMLDLDDVDLFLTIRDINSLNLAKYCDNLQKLMKNLLQPNYKNRNLDLVNEFLNQAKQPIVKSMKKN